MCKSTIVLLAVLSLFVFGCGNGGDDKGGEGSGNGAQPEGGGGGGTPPETGGGGGGTPPDSGGGTPPVFAGGGVAGSYALDASSMIEFLTEMMKARMPDMPDMPDMGDMGDMGGVDEGAAKAMLEKARAEAQKMAAASTLKLVLAADGTFAASGKMMDDDTNAKGTYEVDGENITFTTLEEDGVKQEEPDTITGTIKDGVIKIKPEEEMPFEMIFRKK